MIVALLSIVIAVQGPSVAERGGNSGPQCGLYCVYSLFKLQGLEIQPERIWRAEYCSSRTGSSLLDLKRAAVENGLPAEAYSRLTIGSLAGATRPIILNTRQNAGSPSCNHYVVYLGKEGHFYKIFDPPNKPRPVSKEELYHLWDGAALVPVDPLTRIPAIDYSILGGISVPFLSLTAFLVLTAFLRSRFPRRFGVEYRAQGKPCLTALGSVEADILALLLIIAGASMVFHSLHSAGLLRAPAIVASIEDRNFDTLLPKADRTDVAEASKSNVVLVDARYAVDFEKGHIPGALNIPVDASRQFFAEAVQLLSPQKEVIIYCQSARCKFAARVARRLNKEGFRKLRLYKGGYKEWLSSPVHDLVEGSGADAH